MHVCDWVVIASSAGISIRGLQEILAPPKICGLTAKSPNKKLEMHAEEARVVMESVKLLFFLCVRTKEGAANSKCIIQF